MITLLTIIFLGEKIAGSISPEYFSIAVPVWFILSISLDVTATVMAMDAIL